MHNDSGPPISGSCRTFRAARPKRKEESTEPPRALETARKKNKMTKDAMSSFATWKAWLSGHLAVYRSSSEKMRKNNVSKVTRVVSRAVSPPGSWVEMSRESAASGNDVQTDRRTRPLLHSYSCFDALFSAEMFTERSVWKASEVIDPCSFQTLKRGPGAIPTWQVGIFAFPACCRFAFSFIDEMIVHLTEAVALLEYCSQWTLSPCPEPHARPHVLLSLGFQPLVVCAGTTHVNLAIPTFHDPPVRSGMAHVACPLNESVIRLDHLKRVGAAGRNGHGDWWEGFQC